MNALWPVLQFLAVAALYFLPTLVCERRSHKNTSAILVVNLCLGWTFIGWVVALAWAFSDDGRAAKASPATGPS